MTRAELFAATEVAVGSLSIAALTRTVVPVEERRRASSRKLAMPHCLAPQPAVGTSRATGSAHWLSRPSAQGSSICWEGSRAEELACLVDDVGSGERDTLAVEQAGLPLAGHVRSEEAWGAGEPAYDGGAEGALQIDTNVVMLRL